MRARALSLSCWPLGVPDGRGCRPAHPSSVAGHSRVRCSRLLREFVASLISERLRQRAGSVTGGGTSRGARPHPAAPGGAGGAGQDAGTATEGSRGHAGWGHMALEELPGRASRWNSSGSPRVSRQEHLRVSSQPLVLPFPSSARAGSWAARGGDGSQSRAPELQQTPEEISVLHAAQQRPGLPKNESRFALVSPAGRSPLST